MKNDFSRIFGRRIIGLRQADFHNTNVQIEVPGGGTEADARMVVPEITHEYPENDRFGKTLPAHGIYFRHVKGLKLRNIDICPMQPDAREMLVFDDVEQLKRDD